MLKKVISLFEVLFIIVLAMFLVLTGSDESSANVTSSASTVVDDAFSNAVTIDETSSNLDEQNMEVPLLPIEQSDVTNLGSSLPFPKEKEDLTTSEATSEILYLVEDSSKLAILIDGFGLFVYDDTIKAIIDELETSLTSASNVTVYLCDKDLYREFTSYEDLLVSKSFEPTLGEFFEIVAQLQEENFDRYIIISSQTISFFCPVDESYLEIYYTGLFAENDIIPQVMLYTPANMKSDESEKYLSEWIQSFEENNIDVTHHFILPLVEQQVDN